MVFVFSRGQEPIELLLELLWRLRALDLYFPEVACGIGRAETEMGKVVFSAMPVFVMGCIMRVPVRI